MDLSLARFNKNEIVASHFRQLFVDLREQKPEHVSYFTDGSKYGDRIGAGVWSEEEEWKGRLPNHCTVFGAELYAIYVVLKMINQTNNTYNIIFSGSLSSVLALKSNRSKNENYFVLKIKQRIMNIKSGLELVWIPSHIQILGNERADQLAKA